MIDLQRLTLVFGILGNIISIFVYLSPVPTFRRIYKKKSTESFQSLPYQLSLFSCMIWLYYALLNRNSLFLVTVNSIGCVTETVYTAIYIVYAPKNKRISAIKLFGGMNVVAFLCILVLTRYLVNDMKFRILILGWICVAVSAGVFAAPLNILARVIRTKSVEFMPFTLSFFLTLSAVLWFAYGILRRDIYVIIPNIAGICLGTIQIIVHVIYRNCFGKFAVEGSADQTKDLKTIVVLGPEIMSEDSSTNDVRLNLGGKMEGEVDDQPTTLSLEELSGGDN